MEIKNNWEEIKKKIWNINKFYDYNHSIEDYDVLVNLTEITNLMESIQKEAYREGFKAAEEKFNTKNHSIGEVRITPDSLDFSDLTEDEDIGEKTLYLYETDELTKAAGIYIVSVSYAKNHTYEDCPYKSFKDTEQGFCQSYNWIKLTEYKTEFTGTAHIPQGYADLIRGRIDYLEKQNNFKKWTEIGVLETFLDECVIENPNIERLKSIKESLNNPQFDYFSPGWLSEAKELCEIEGIDFKNFLKYDDFDSKQSDKKIKKNIEREL